MAKGKVKKNKYEVDTSNYDESKDSGGYNGDEPKRGIYDAVLSGLSEHTSDGGNEGLKWTFDITEEPYEGWRGWVYSNMDSTQWRTDQIVNAINGGKKGKFVLDPSEKGEDAADNKTVKSALPVRVRIKHEEYDGETRAKIRTVLVNEDAGKKSKKKGKSGKDDDAFGD